MYIEQEELKSSGVLVHTISKALDWINNASCIVFSPYPHDLPNEVKENRDLLPRGLTCASTGGYTTKDHPFRQLIGAIYLSQYTGIREFRAEYFDKRTPGTEFALPIFDMRDDIDIAAAKFFFQHLEKLVLNIALNVPYEAFVPDDTLSKFAELLRSTTKLQSLSLHPTHWWSMVGARPLFNELGLRTKWPNLQYLSLQGVVADQQDFMGMIKRHKDTLTSVKFSKCSLFTGTWADIVDEVVYATKILPFVLDRVNERGRPELNYSAMSASEREAWKYAGQIEETKDGDRVFVRT